MYMLILGAVAMGSLVAGLFFLRFWQQTHDRFFLFFSLAFLVEGINRVVLGALGGIAEDSAAIYLVRLLSFGLILAAIVHKNLTARVRRP